MKPISILILLCLALAGCVSSGDDDDDNFNMPEANRAILWTRNNPVFVSGINVSMGSPPTGFVNTYYNQFHATAVHVWADGLPGTVNGWEAARSGGFRFVSWVHENGTSGANGLVIGGISANRRGRIGFQIGDEPGRFCDTTDCAINNLNLINTGINAVQAADPNALIIINFTKGDHLEGALDHYSKQMNGDIISYSHYSYRRAAYKSLEAIRRYGRAYSKPYWCYLKAYIQPNDPDGKTASDMRWNAYSAALYGFTGFTWFVYQINTGNEVVSDLFNQPGTFGAGRTGLWGEAARINVGLQHLGRYLTKLNSTAVRFIPAKSFLQPEGTTEWYEGSGDDPYITDIGPADNGDLMEISVGFFQNNEGKQYFMLQNVAHTHWVSTDIIDLVDRATIRVHFDFADAPETTSRSRLLALNKGTGQARGIPLVATEGAQRYMDITLPPGDVILLWYDTTA